MKKVLAMLVVASMALSAPCLGADLNYGSYSDSELQYIVDSARTELYQRQQRTENGNLVLCDVDGVQVALTGAVLKADYSLRLEVVVSNNSDKSISIGADKGYLNGWDTGCLFSVSRLEPKKKIRDAINIGLEKAGISDITEIEDASFSFFLFDPETYSTTWESPEMQIFLSEDFTSVLSVQEVVLIG